MIPFDNFSYLNKKYKRDILKEINKTLSFNSAYEHEKYVNSFLDTVKDFFRVNYVIGTDSGTTALQLALLSNGVGEGDEVLLP
jgi:dTDP-4-amino-4,6-dideoxygalactose transaminase